MKKKKIKWVNVVKLLIFVFCLSTIIHNVYLLTIYSWIKGTLYGITWYGILELVLFFSIVIIFYKDFDKQIEKTPASRNSQRQK